MRLRFAASCLFAAGILVAGCGRGPSSGDPTRAAVADEARVYAAASLTDVVGALVKDFERRRRTRVVPAYGASNTLAHQLRDGAKPGVFISASLEWADKLASWGLVEEGSRVDLVSNALVVVVPKDAKERPVKLQDLADARFARIALADPVAVPAGKYAEAALRKAGLFESLRARIVAAQDVRTALSYVERGETPVGIVYATDAAASSRVDVACRVDPGLHPKIEYPMLLVKGADAVARELHAFLRSDDAWPVLERAGFVKP
jgi:molybdate transport system substrate-binding protein